MTRLDVRPCAMVYTEITCKVEGCPKSKDNAGMCWKHYYRVRRFGDPHRIGRVVYGTAQERFDAKVSVEGECLLWTAALNKGGYGVFNDEENRAVLAHRWAYAQVHGPIPERDAQGKRLTLDHLCRNRACVKVEHLELVTDQVQVDRAVNHYGARTHCSRGHEFSGANLITRSDGGRRCRTCTNKRVRARNRKV